MRRTLPVLMALLLTACGGEEFQDLRDFVKNAGADMRGKIPPAPEVKPYEPFLYENNTSLPDPFKPRKPDMHSGGGANQPDLTRPREELEEFPLENLKMVGSLTQNEIVYAVIRGPDSKLRRVKAGNYVGMNFGLITAVTENSVEIKEMVQDSVGDWSERASSLQLLE